MRPGKISKKCCTSCTIEGLARKGVPPPLAEYLKFLAPYSAEIRDLALATRALVFEEAPDASELIYDAYNAVASGYTFTGRPSDAFVLKLGTSADLCIVKTSTNNCTAPKVSPAIVSAGSQVTFTYTITNLGPDLATNITFTDNWTGVAVTFNSATAASGSCPSTAANSTIVCTIPSLQSGSTATVLASRPKASSARSSSMAQSLSSTCRPV